ncbi:hypothetical protein V865_000565 [Kwoniella europaea PYCC6329]|uniref:Calpain catalytic domain-containing protein n=1 Tax=Kwoniella europaea PYCC6329 TaxID=1423913 RepID=A0AAX4K838_9TREE
MYTNLFVSSLVLGTSLVIDATPIYKRDVGPLFGPSGIPSPDDIEQHHLDCGYVASIMTLTDRAPLYVKSLISFDEGAGFNSIEQVTATCWTLPRDEEGTDIWWPGALYQAPIHQGVVTDPRGEGGMPSLAPGVAMTMITGKRAEGKEPKDLEDFWQIILKVNDSPMVPQTKAEGCTTLWGAHAYAITKATEDTPGDRTVDLINTNGEREHLEAQQVFADTVLLVNWVDYPSFVDERAP